MNVAQRPKFKDKFKTLSLKFCRSGVERRSEISHKSGAKFQRTEVKFQGINLLRRIFKARYKALLARGLRSV
ncbi:MAG: hypothetical protein ACFNVQ_07365 [Campylobacter sp.]